jgi:hypothetical protein
MPLLSHPDCREQWSETVQRDIMDKMHAFLANLYVMIGSTKGEAPLPSSVCEFVSQWRFHCIDFSYSRLCSIFISAG